ncbi:MAG: hypothetical protein M3Z31_10445 [Pseudomonadota bacterium]|nr:hypothetical protein [Pseudomonadota bacterium]
MDVSAWWVVGAFVAGGYAGALLVALIAVSASDGGSRAGGGGRGVADGNAAPWSY